MSNILDELERLSKEATPGNWMPWMPCGDILRNEAAIRTQSEYLFYSYGTTTMRATDNARLIATMRNNIDALIQVARAASDLVGTDNIGKTVDIRVAFEGGVSAVFQGKALNALVKALEKLK